MEKTKQQFQEEYYSWGKVGLLDELWTKEQSLINLEKNYRELELVCNREREEKDLAQKSLAEEISRRKLLEEKIKEHSSGFVQVDDSEEKIRKLEEALQKAELEAFRYKQSLQTVLELLKS